MAIRTVLVQMPRMLEEIVLSMLDAAQDFEVSGCVESTIEAMRGARSRDFDAAIVVMGDDIPPVARSMVEVNSSLKVLMLTADARAAFMYDLSPRLVPVAEVNGTGLLDAIRDAVSSEMS